MFLKSMILVVDDDSTFLEQAQKALDRDRQVYIASDADQAWSLAQRFGFSVMLVDLELGEGDGLDLIERLHDAFPKVAIVAISDRMSGRRELTHLKARGAAALLSKPITPEWKTLVEQLPAMGRRK